MSARSLITMMLVAASIAACSSDKKKGDSNDASVNDGGVNGGGDGGLGWSDADVTIVPLAGVAIGTCGAPAEDPLLIAELATVDCSLPHPLEVAGRFELTGDYPGHMEILSKAYYGCIPVVEEYIGEEFWESSYDIKTVSPSPTTWSDGDREVLCFLVKFDRKPLVGSQAKNP